MTVASRRARDRDDEEPDEIRAQLTPGKSRRGGSLVDSDRVPDMRIGSGTASSGARRARLQLTDHVIIGNSGHNGSAAPLASDRYCRSARTSAPEEEEYDRHNAG